LSEEARKQIGAEVILCADEAALGHATEANKAAALIVANPDVAETDAMEVLPPLRIAHRADLIESIFAAVNDRHPLSVAGLRILGLAEEANGKLDLARATLERVFAQDSSSEVVLVDLARIAKAAKDYQGALGYLAHARELKPTDASLPYEFGVVCIWLSLLGEARKAMAEAVKMEPDNPEYNFGMGTISSFAQDATQGHYGISGLDPISYLSATTLLIVVLATAALLPIRRAFRIDIARVLHSNHTLWCLRSGCPSFRNSTPPVSSATGRKTTEAFGTTRA
jgi:tetratricopeptide (TPR) repeat protein